MDRDSFVPLIDLHDADEVDLTSIPITIDFDFTQRYYKIQYYAIVDMMQALGGLRASFTPILSYLLPLLALSFFYQMSAIIHDNYNSKTTKEFEEFMDATIMTLLEAEAEVKLRS